MEREREIVKTFICVSVKICTRVLSGFLIADTLCKYLDQIIMHPRPPGRHIGIDS